MTNKYDIYFNSGADYANHYSPGSNVSFFEITNSDDTYYQNGVVQLYKSSAQSIGDTCMILIDGSVQFNGYVSRKQKTIEKGTAFDTYQLVGKTYDLWRYVTDSNAKYSGTTAYIASSLVADYCSGIDGLYVTPTNGISLSNEIDLSNIQVGDAIVRLTELDGYSFYVDNSDHLHYYAHSGTYKFSITEDDIISMSPIEEADEDLINDCLVVGGSDYSTRTNIAPNHSSFGLVPSGVLIAQQFLAEDPRLSAVKLYLDRSADPNQPETLNFEIWGNTETTLFEDTFDDSSYLDVLYSTNTYLGNLVLSGALTSKYSYSTYNGGGYRYMGIVFSINSGQCVERTWHGGAGPTETTYWAEIRKAHNNLPSGPVLYSSSAVDNGTINIYFDSAYCSSDAMWTITMYRENLSIFGYKHGPIGTLHRTFAGDTYDDYTDYGGGINGINGGVYLRDYPKWGTASSNTYTNDCRYMKIELSDVVSSNHIFISGTNDGGTTWKTLNDGKWVDFGSESSAGCIVSYKLSSNGRFTPKIGGATLKISDDTGRFEDEVFDDNFNDNSFLSSQATGAKIYNGAIYISTSRHEYYSGTKNPIGCEYTIYDGYDHWNGDPGSIEGALIDGSWLTYAQDYGGGNNRTITDIYEFDAPMLCDGIYAMAYAQSHSDVEMRDIYISTTWSGWIHVFDGAIDLETEPGEPAEILFDDDWIYSGIRKIKVQMRQFSGYEGANLKSFGIVARVIGSGSHYSGLRRCFKTKNYELSESLDLEFLKVVPTNRTYPHCIKFSGSLTTGSSWTSMSSNTVVDVDDGKNAVLMYCFQTSGVCKKVKWAPHPITNSPSIDRTRLYSMKVQGGGIPQSGTKVEWSDDISWTAGDVPYPPSYSSWKTYSEPKLAPDNFEGNNYWAVISHGGGDTSVEHEDYFTASDTWNAWGDCLWHSYAGGWWGLAGTSPLPKTGGILKSGISIGSPTYLILEVNGQVTSDSSMHIYCSGNGYKWTLLGTELGSYTIPDTLIGGGTISFKLSGMNNRADDSLRWNSVILYSDDSFWKFGYETTNEYDGKIAYSWDNGIHWSTNSDCPGIVPKGNMSMQLGWKQGEITYRASNQSSINTYGRHFKKVSESSYTTYEQAQARAELEISGMESIPKKGTITIDGTTDIDTYYRFSSNLSNFGINELWDVVSYTQRIDNNGFTTTINYGKQPFDIVRKIGEIEHKQETE